MRIYKYKLTLVIKWWVGTSHPYNKEETTTTNMRPR
nr:MAG TPA: hypothetical protein [Bacteriophage sp.]